MKYLLTIFFLLLSGLVSATALDAETRIMIPDEYVNIHQQVSYLIEPFSYEIIYDQYAPIEAKSIGYRRGYTALDENHTYPITTVILSILPDDVALVIDEKNKFVSFQYLKD